MPTSDGIDDADWDKVKELAADIANQTTEEDCDIPLEPLLDFLERLEFKYGRLPSIIATRADYIQDPMDQLALYEEAYSSACEANDAVNKTMISSSIADLYMNEIRESSKARYWLGLFAKSRENFTDVYFDELYLELEQASRSSAAANKET